MSVSNLRGWCESAGRSRRPRACPSRCSWTPRHGEGGQPRWVARPGGSRTPKGPIGSKKETHYSEVTVIKEVITFYTELHID